MNNKPHIWPMTPKKGMLDFPVAVVVSYLHSHFQYPEQADLPSKVIQDDSAGILQLTDIIDQQILLFAEFISCGSVTPYSRSSRRRIDIDLALDLLAANNTDDIIIYGHDLLFGDRYPANLLQDVVVNAREILKNYPSLFSVPQQSNQSRAQKHLLCDDEVEMVEAATTDTTTPGNDWIDKARAIADRIALKRYESGVREITARNICDAVQLELAKDVTTHGNRGERSAGNIRNEALRGWKFIPPTGTNGTSGTKK